MNDTTQVKSGNSEKNVWAILILDFLCVACKVQGHGKVHFFIDKSKSVSPGTIRQTGLFKKQKIYLPKFTLTEV